MHNPFSTATFANNGTGQHFNKILFVRPVSSHKSVGIDFDLAFNVTTQSGSTSKESQIEGHFNCRPEQPCNNLMLLRYKGKSYNVSVAVKNTTQASMIGAFVGDLQFVTRYDNMSFEYTTVCFVFFFCLIFFSLSFLLFCNIAYILSLFNNRYHPISLLIIIYSNIFLLFLLLLSSYHLFSR